MLTSSVQAHVEESACNSEKKKKKSIFISAINRVSIGDFFIVKIRLVYIGLSINLLWVLEKWGPHEYPNRQSNPKIA